MEKKEEKILGVRAFDNYFENKLVISRKYSDFHYVIGFAKFFMSDNGAETGLFVYEYSRKEKGFLSTPVKVNTRDTFILLPYLDFLTEDTGYFDFLDDIWHSLELFNICFENHGPYFDSDLIDELNFFRESLCLDEELEAKENGKGEPLPSGYTSNVSEKN